MRKKKSYYALEHLIKREWNTCLTASTGSNGVLEFSGFYGDYTVTVTADSKEERMFSYSFDKEGGTLTIAVN